MSTLTPPAADMPDFNAVISDLDGVVYRGDAPIPEAVDAFRRWHAAGVRYCFVTNNSTRTAADFAAKLRRLGIEARAEQVVTSADATALLLRERWPSGARVFVIGAPALAETIGAAGFEIAADRAEIVVVGLDQQFTYAKLKQASRLVRAGAELIGTNPDLMLPTEDGFDPGAGTLIGAVTAASGRPAIFVGKPEPHMITAALQRLGSDARRTVMIGDQVSTDIEAGQRAGLFSILVQTGVPEAAPTHIRPDLTVPTLAVLI